MGVCYRPAKSSRRPGSSQETRRNFPLEFYFCGNSDVRSGIGPLGLIGAKEIEIPFDCNARARHQFEVFNAGITYLDTGAILAVLNDGVVQVQLLLCMRDDVIGAKACVVKLAEDPKLPIVVGLINQRRLGKNS